MKDFLLELARSQPTAHAKRNAMREYLQAYILRTLHREAFFRFAAFVGGTALRFLHQLPRFSEDLDFSLTNEGPFAFSEFIKAVKGDLTVAGYQVSVTYKDERTVKYAFVKFSGLLNEMGLSSHANEKFSVKLEVDARPPEGAGMETKLVNKFFPLAFVAYDLPSLLAGKIHALLSRRYTKGRDYFDLGWYLSKWPDLVPNFLFLRNALTQTGWKGDIPVEKNWKNILRAVVQKADWKSVRRDVANFLERPADVDILSQENILGLLR